MISLDQYLEMRDLDRVGMSKTRIAHQMGVDRKTVRKYVRKGAGPPVSGNKRFRERLAEPYEGYLKERMAKGCTNGQVLFREIEAQGYRGSYPTLRRFLKPLREEEAWRGEIRWEAPPGLYAQVDWGEFRAELEDGSRKKLYAFVFTLVYSRTSYVEWTTRMDSATLKRCHEHAFEYVGGVPKYIVYDRMKTVVLGEKNGKVQIQKRFEDFAQYYGFTPKPTPPSWPKGKGKVESGVKYVRRNFWQGLQTIRGLDDLNWRCREWLDKIANPRIHGTTGRAPFEMLPEERLEPLRGKPSYPVNPAVMRRVSRDGLVSYQGCRYSVPAEWTGKMVWVRAVGSERVIVTAEGRVIAEHRLERELKRTVITDWHYASLRGRPRPKSMQVIPRIEAEWMEVEHRALSDYEALVEVGR